MEDIIVRKAKINDYDDIIRLYKQLYDAEKVFDDNLKKDFKIGDKEEIKIKKKIKSRKDIFLVAELGGKIVGLIDGVIIENILHKEKVAYLDHVCVDEKHRRKAIGTKLIDEFSERAKLKGAKFIKLNAFENNIKAVNLYKKYGFAEYSIFYMKKM